MTARKVRKLIYDSYLMTNYWKVIREKVLDRDGHKCRKCGATTNLQIHHLTYAHRGNELAHLNELVCLCETCHKQVHRRMKLYKAATKLQLAVSQKDIGAI